MENNKTYKIGDVIPCPLCNTKGFLPCHSSKNGMYISTYSECPRCKAKGFVRVEISKKLSQEERK